MDTQMTARVEGEVLVIAVTGTMAADSAEDAGARMAADLRAALDRGPVDLLLDLAGLTFMDSAGLRVVLEAFQTVTGAGGRMALAAIQPNVARLLDVAGLGTHLTIYSGADEAVAALNRPRPR
ncbi:STAS domain-containing protein [Spirillospora sp. NPDC047279]|uniref:STAS domain-containing protein n=1 Tax=Spirillospora sp. NPDC047279 TaxID=3155478 RepID=UPI003400593E